MLKNIYVNTMLIFILGILLLLLLLNYIPRSYKEGATMYDESNCQSIAKQNQNNIEALEPDMKKILDLQSKVDSIQAQINSNTKQLSLMAEKVYKSPK
jgi:hypothetical protein